MTCGFTDRRATARFLSDPLSSHTCDSVIQPRCFQSRQGNCASHQKGHDWVQVDKSGRQITIFRSDSYPIAGSDKASVPSTRQHEVPPSLSLLYPQLPELMARHWMTYNTICFRECSVRGF